MGESVYIVVCTYSNTKVSGFLNLGCYNRLESAIEKVKESTPECLGSILILNHFEGVDWQESSVGDGIYLEKEFFDGDYMNPDHSICVSIEEHLLRS